MLLPHGPPSLLAALVSLSSLAHSAFAAQAHFKPGHQAHNDCLHSSSVTQINHLLRAGGEGTNVVLCPYAQILVDPHGYPIIFTAPRQSIYTSGSPEDHSRATISISHPKGHFTGDLTTAIKANCANCRGVVIRNIQVDGGRAELGGIEGGDALILVGGKVGEQEVRSVDAWGARGYAIVHASGASFFLSRGRGLGLSLIANELRAIQRDLMGHARASLSPTTASTRPETPRSTSCSTRNSCAFATARLLTAAKSDLGTGPTA